MRWNLGKTSCKEAFQRFRIETFRATKHPSAQSREQPRPTRHRGIETGAKLIVSGEYNPFTIVRCRIDGRKRGIQIIRSRIKRSNRATKIRQQQDRAVVSVNDREMACFRYHESVQLGNEGGGDAACYFRRKKNSKTWSLSALDSS